MVSGHLAPEDSSSFGGLPLPSREESSSFIENNVLKEMEGKVNNDIRGKSDTMGNNNRIASTESDTLLSEQNISLEKENDLAKET